MKKSIVLFAVTFAIISIATSFVTPVTAEAQQVVTCPAGYTCTAVPQTAVCPVGYVCTPIEVPTTPQLPCSTVGANSCVILPTTASVTVVGAPSLDLTYDSTNKESALNARFSINISGGNTGLLVYRNLSLIHFIDQKNQSYGISVKSDINTSDLKVLVDAKGLAYFEIPANQIVTFDVLASAKPSQMFAGTYTASLYALQLVAPVNVMGSNSTISSYNLVASANKTNAKTIIGETSPYISSVTPNILTAIFGNTLTGSPHTAILNGFRLGSSKLFVDGTIQPANYVSVVNSTNVDVILPTSLTIGYHSLYLSGANGNSNNISFQVVSGSATNTPIISSDAKATILGTPSLVLAYDSAQKESLLKATFDVSVNGGTTGVNVYQNGFQVSTIDQTGNWPNLNSVAEMPITLVSGNAVNSYDNNGQPTFYVSPNNTATLRATVTAKPSQMFAGTYYMKLVGLNVASGSNAVANLSTVGSYTNKVTIVGETSPYITSVTNPISVGQTMTLVGQRFSIGTQALYPQIYLDGAYLNVSFKIPTGGTSAYFTLPNMVIGHHTIAYSTYNGMSNTVGFDVLSATSTQFGIVASLDQYSPITSTVKISPTSVTQNVPLAIFDLVSQNQPSTLRTLSVDMSVYSPNLKSGALTQLFTNIFVKIGGQTYAETSVVGNTVTFGNINVSLPANATVAFTVLGSVAMDTNNFYDKSNVSVQLPLRGISAYDQNNQPMVIGQSNVAGLLSGSTITFDSGSSVTTPSLTILSPNGNTWTVGNTVSTYPIRWTTSPDIYYVNLAMYPSDSLFNGYFVTGALASAGSYNAALQLPMRAGAYILEINGYNSNNNYLAGSKAKFIVQSDTAPTSIPVVTTPVVTPTYSLIASPSSVTTGSPLTLTWSVVAERSSHTTDWVALYKVGDANTSYGAWKYTSGCVSTCIFSIVAPSTPGSYEFRYLTDGGYTSVAKSNIVTVTSETTTCPSGQTWSGSMCTVQVQTNTNGQLFVSVISPVARESFAQGQTVPIRFTTNLTDSQNPNGFNILLYSGGNSTNVGSFGSPIQYLVNNWTGGSPYNWTIPTTVPAGNYVVYIVPSQLAAGISNIGLFAFGNSYLTITAPATINTSTSSVAPDLSALNAALITARGLISSASIGLAPGQYAQNIVNSLNSSINFAAGSNNPNASQANIDAAVRVLNKGISDFRSSVNPAAVAGAGTSGTTNPSANTVTRVISNVYPSVAVSTTPNAPITVSWNTNFLANDVAVLTVYLHSTNSVSNDVVLASNLSNNGTWSTWSGKLVGNNQKVVAPDTYNVYVGGSVSGQTVSAASQGILTVVAAPDKQVLNNYLSLAQSIRNEAKVGTTVGYYPQSAVTSLDAAIAAANAVNNDSAATQNTIDNFVKTLGDSITTFKSTVITTNPVDKSSLLSQISSAQAIRNAAVVGTANGNFTQSAVNTLDNAILLATTIRDRASASQSDVNTAVSTIQSSVATFNASALKVADVAQYTVSTAAVTPGGDTNGGSIYTTGSSVSLVAYPAAGYHFVNWADSNGTPVSTANPYNITVTKNVSLGAYFAADSNITVSLTANNTANNVTITKMTGVTLRWTVTGAAASCTGSGSWTGAKAKTGGAQIMGQISANKTYILTCIDSNGQAVTSTVVVTIGSTASAGGVGSNSASVWDALKSFFGF